MDSKKIAKLCLDQMVLSFIEIQKKYPEFQLYFPAEIRIDYDIFTIIEDFEEIREECYKFGINLLRTCNVNEKE